MTDDRPDLTDDELRAMGPGGLAPDRHTALRSRLLEEIATDRSGASMPPEAHPSSADAPTPRRVPPWAIGAAAAVVLAGLVALAVRQTPQADERVLSTTSTSTSTVVVAPGPPVDPATLDAARIACAQSDQPDARRVDAIAVPRAAGDPVTADDMVEACTEIARQFGSDRRPPPLEACVDDATPPWPTVVVVVDGSTCATAGARAATDEDLRRINDARTLEAALRAVPGTCPSREDAVRWATQQIDAADADLAVVVRPGGGDACTAVEVSWRRGTAEVVPAG